MRMHGPKYIYLIGKECYNSLRVPKYNPSKTLSKFTEATALFVGLKVYKYRIQASSSESEWIAGFGNAVEVLSEH